MNQARKTKSFLCIMLALAAILVCALTLTARLGLLHEERKLLGSVEVGQTGTAEAHMDGWTTFTYANASDFTETVFDGEEAYYYELDCGSEEQYAMDAYLTSPDLLFYPTDYVLECKYFTRQRAATPNVLTVYASSDGVNYVESGSVSCFDSGAEVETWRTAEVRVAHGFTHLRIGLTVYYAGEGLSRIDKSGIYLSKTYYLKAEKHVAVYEDEFSLSAADDGEGESLVYNGEAQYPDYTVTAPESGYYYVSYAEQNGVRVEPVASGTYDFCAAFYDDVNELVCVK